MNNKNNVFSGCIPALMTPCDKHGTPDFDALAAKGRELVDIGHEFRRVLRFDGRLAAPDRRTANARGREARSSGRTSGRRHRRTEHTPCRRPVPSRKRGRCRRSHGHPKSLVTRLVCRGAAQPLCRDSRCRQWPSRRHLQQPLLRIRNAGRSVLRVAPRARKSRRLSRNSAARPL